ncbi:hypothetical protein ACOSP7_005817 [Xanthoceras sorbifolium]
MAVFSTKEKLLFDLFFLNYLVERAVIFVLATFSVLELSSVFELSHPILFQASFLSEFSSDLEPFLGYVVDIPLATSFFQLMFLEFNTKYKILFNLERAGFFLAVVYQQYKYKSCLFIAVGILIVTAGASLMSTKSEETAEEEVEEEAEEEDQEAEMENDDQTTISEDRDDRLFQERGETDHEDQQSRLISLEEKIAKNLTCKLETAMENAECYQDIANQFLEQKKVLEAAAASSSSTTYNARSTLQSHHHHHHHHHHHQLHQQTTSSSMKSRNIEPSSKLSDTSSYNNNHNLFEENYRSQVSAKLFAEKLYQFHMLLNELEDKFQILEEEKKSSFC